jgi:hypothetical protein
MKVEHEPRLEQTIHDDRHQPRDGIGSAAGVGPVLGITGHFVDRNGDDYIDIFSCKSFDIDAAVRRRLARGSGFAAQADRPGPDPGRGPVPVAGRAIMAVGALLLGARQAHGAPGGVPSVFGTARWRTTYLT